MAYSRLRSAVRTASAATTATHMPAAAIVSARARAGHFARRRSTRVHASVTANTDKAASGRYIRRSAPTSLAIGTTLDVGASVRKNMAPRNPIAGHRTSATTVPASSASSSSACGRTSATPIARGRP